MSLNKSQASALLGASEAQQGKESEDHLDHLEGSEEGAPWGLRRGLLREQTRGMCAEQWAAFSM